VLTRRGRPAARAPRGLGLVELMVGIAIGLFVVSAAIGLAVTHLDNNRRLQIEAQLQQDLRAAVDIVARELRRAGMTAMPAAFVATPTQSGGPSGREAVTPAVDPDDPVVANAVVFAYERQPAVIVGPFGFRLGAAGAGPNARGVVQTLLAGGGWQELTDPQVIDVTTFRVTARPFAPLPVVCPRACTGGGTDCWPTVTVREYLVEVGARAVHDPRIERRLDAVVRLRNDLVGFNDPAAPTQLCPP
jgi:type IV pilus assembly protein PilW